MTKRSILEYKNKDSYNSGKANHPDNSIVSVVSHETVFDGVNVVVDAVQQNAEVGDMLLYDKQERTHKLLKTRTYKAALFDNDRYIKSNMLFYVSVFGTGLFLYTGQQTAMWGARNEYVIDNFDLSQSGGFSFKSTGYQAKSEATSISWQAGDSLQSVFEQIAVFGNGAVMGNASYSSAAIEGDKIVLKIGGLGTNLVTIDKMEGGGSPVEITDYSEFCKIGDTILSGDQVHRSFQGSTVASCFPSIASLLLSTSTGTYTKSKVDRGYRAGLYFPLFKSYVAANGSATFVDDTTAGNVWPMKEETFLACGSSSTPAEKACYDRHNGSWDDYLMASMADIFSMKGSVAVAYGNLGIQGKLLASIFYMDRNNEWQPCYPAAYQASLMGVTVEGYNTGFEPGNLHLVDNFDLVAMFDPLTVGILRNRLSVVGGTNIGSSYLWSGSCSDGNNAWVFSATNGALYAYSKLTGSGVRGSLDFKFKS